tara:strand:+ start:128 stop:1492 length:1365 start_codon:yes stop_codon:yes gene_type:complete
MFTNLSERLQRTVKTLRGQARLTEDNIKDTLRDIRMSLLEADVALPVVKDFIAQLKEKVLGEKVATSLNPGQALIKIVNDQLTELMGSENAELDFKTQPPAIILMAGLQGSGKTTSTAKLAKLLKEQHKKSVLVTSADVYRPAAIKQLETLAKSVDVTFFPSDISQKPVDIAKAAIVEAKKTAMDVVIIDTAGRLAIDEAMMAEIKAVHKAINPIETLFVVDSMTGQDAANTAKAFNDALPLTGVILTKADGDARGGAALSVRQITGKPIKFMGVGEKTDALQVFHPDRIASRILGMGDMLSLIEEVEQKTDKAKAEKMAKKLKKGGFDLQDFADQLQQMNNMGGMDSLLGKIPGVPNIAAAKEKLKTSMPTQYIPIIQSMTRQEKRFPALIKASRKLRIAAGSGTQVQDINRLLKQFMQMQKMMKKVGKKGGMDKMMRAMQGAQGQMPPGMMG